MPRLSNTEEMNGESWTRAKWLEELFPSSQKFVRDDDISIQICTLFEFEKVDKILHRIIFKERLEQRREMFSRQAHSLPL